MTITLTIEQAQTIYDALDASMDNIELDRLNDDEDEFADLETQVGEARDFMEMLIERSKEG